MVESTEKNDDDAGFNFDSLIAQQVSNFIKIYSILEWNWLRPDSSKKLLRKRPQEKRLAWIHE